MGKTRIIAETGAGQHGVATATVCALFGLQCVVYMGTEDIRRQSLNVFRMKLLGAEVRRRGFGQQNAQRRDQRGVARLGDEPGRHALFARLGVGAASVSDDGARFSKRDRQRSARTNYGEGREACPII